MWSDRVGVCAIDATAEKRAKDIATQLQLPYVADATQYPLLLRVGEQTLVLRRMATPVIDWSIDFLSPAYQDKRAKRTRKNDALARALGLHKNAALRVLDMSAGLGKDAYWIAHCGARVTLLERNPLLAYLLQHAIDALRADPIEGPIGERMTVLAIDAISYLNTVEAGEFDVAYYDPMFLPRRKSALVKKDMQIMHDLLGEDLSSDLCEAVLTKIPCLVVKRAKNDPVYHKTPAATREAGTIRYEAYRKNI